jgi:thiamine pyrophosphate-dependent acetolactate synthase large subunit-like protein
MRVSEAVGKALADAGVGQVFGVVGSGNFRVTNAIVANGVPFVAARHENGAAVMADAYTRMSGRTGVLSVHQGPGFTNALTGIVEAAKSHTPVLVLAPHSPDFAKTSNFWIDELALAETAGCAVVRLESAESAVEDALRALAHARRERTPVVLGMSNDIQDQEFTGHFEAFSAVESSPVGASQNDVARLIELLAGAERPVFVVGRGGTGARDEILHLAEMSGALLATSAVARGLFEGEPWNLDVSGGFSSPTVTELLSDADVLIVWGASLNRWTARNGSVLVGKTVVHIDDRVDAFDLHYPADVHILGDAGETARQANAAWARDLGVREGYRTAAIAQLIGRSADWRSIPFDDTSAGGKIDPRTLTIGLDTILPHHRVVVPDGGNFNGYPAMFFGVPDEHAYCLTLAFGSIGLGLATGIGAATALPDRTVIVGVGDGGFLMSLVELETAARLGLNLVVVVYNDDAYGAEVHHFGPYGDSVDLVEFPPTDIAAIAGGFGCDAVTITGAADLDQVRAWVDGPRDRPLVIDAKITSFLSWVSRHAFEVD